MSVLTDATTTVDQDAKQRTVRSLVQGGIAAVLMAVFTVLVPAIQDGVYKVDWSKLGYSVLTAALITAGSYIMGKVLPAINPDSAA